MLDLEQNLLTGQFFTEAILSLSEIVALRASFNDLNGTIPEDIDRLSKVEQLWIAENQFNGALPTQLGNLQSLDSLFLYNNTFDGPIISEFGTLANLTQLRLYGNVLNGEIPEELYDATRLRVLRVDLNFLQGGLSTSIGKLVELEDFRMNDQFPPGFTGSVPAELSQCSLLRKYLVTGLIVIAVVLQNLNKLTIASLLDHYHYRKLASQQQWLLRCLPRRLFGLHQTRVSRRVQQ